MNNSGKLIEGIFSNSANEAGATKIGEKIVTINIPPEFMWLLLSVVLLFFISMSFVFHYHWKKYGVNENPKIFAKSLYWVVSFILIIIMLFALIGFEYF